MSHIADITITALEAGKIRDLLIVLDEVARKEQVSGECTKTRVHYLSKIGDDASAMEQELLHRLLTTGVVNDKQEEEHQS